MKVHRLLGVVICLSYRLRPARAAAGLARTATPAVAAAGRRIPGVETDLPALPRAPFFTIRTCPPPGTELGPRTNGSTLVSALPIHWDTYRDRVHSRKECVPGEQARP